MLKDRDRDILHTSASSKYTAEFHAIVQDIRSSTVLEDHDLDIIRASDITFLKHLGNGAFGTVRFLLTHVNFVAVYQL